MYPILFQIGKFAVYTYGVMLALGFVTSMWLAKRQLVKLGVEKEFVYDLAFVLILSGLIGARIMYIINNIHWFIENPVDIIKIPNGGLIFYGGLLLATIMGFLYTKWKKQDSVLIVDALIPYVPFAHMFGRIGCFLNGCCWGAPTDSPFGVFLQHKPYPVHPVQLYEAVSLFFLFVVLKIVFKFKKFSFQVFVSYFIGYGAIRFVMESFRGDNPYILGNMSLSKLISLVLFVTSIIIYFILFVRYKKLVTQKNENNDNNSK